MRIVSIVPLVAVALFVAFCGFHPQPMSGAVVCTVGGSACCPAHYVCVGRGAITADGLTDATGTCWSQQDLPPEALSATHDYTPNVLSDPACLVTDWLPPDMGLPDGGDPGVGGRVVGGGGGYDGSISIPPIGGTGAEYGAFPVGSASPATNWAINAVHDNAQPNDVVASPLTKKWTAHFTGEVSFPVVANGRVFVSAAEAQPNVRALDVETGAPVWGPIAIGGTVWLACDAANLYTLDFNGNLSALNAASGNRNWTTKLTAQYDFSSPPTVAGGMVYVNGMGEGGTTFGVEAATGKIKWMADTFDGSDGTVAVLNGFVYEAEACGQVSAFDAYTGKLRWFVHLGSCTGGGGSTPAIYQGHMWILDSDGNLILDLNGKGNGATFSANSLPSFHSGNAYYMNRGTLTAVDATNQAMKWTFTGPDNFYSLNTSAVIAGAGGQVFVGSEDCHVYELNEADGTLVSSDRAAATDSCDSYSMVEKGMTIAHNHLFVPAGKDLVVY